MKRFSVLGATIAALLSAAPLARAEVKLPAIISQHMVLQKGVAVPIWGWAEAGEQVTVKLRGQTKTAQPGPDGRWMVKLDPLEPGAPATLTVQGKNTLTIADVLVGEVWLGSGQSNMGMMVQAAQNFAQEQAAAKLPEIRVFTEGSSAAETPQTIGKGAWVICSPETVGRFSATLFFFGREVQKSIGGTVGLINSSVGGTPIESWIAQEAQERTAALKPFLEQVQQEEARFDPAAAKAKYEQDMAKWKVAVEKAKLAGTTQPIAPRDPVGTRVRKGKLGGLFNGKIAPLIPYAIRGAIWYQGEANGNPGKAPFYQYQLPLLITDWRARWGEGDFPFAWAQLPNVGGRDSGWPLVREAMLKTLRLPQTGMGINIDLGEEHNVHPKNKQEVGRRLALWALGAVYGQAVPATSGPLPVGHEVHGGEIAVTFAHAEGGLTAREGELKGFTIAGEDQKFVPATARIERGKVVVASPAIAKPMAVRYSWASWPDGNLVNGAALPATPFRTDDWAP